MTNNKFCKDCKYFKGISIKEISDDSRFGILGKHICIHPDSKIPVEYNLVTGEILNGTFPFDYHECYYMRNNFNKYINNINTCDIDAKLFEPKEE